MTVVTAFSAATAMAGDSYLSAGSKAQGNFGQLRNNVFQSRPMYRSTQPMIVRSEPAPNAVAAAPTEQRSFSAEPAQKADNAQAQRSTRTNRSYSYEPGYDSYRSRSRSSVPAYALPKTAAGKFGGR